MKKILALVLCVLMIVGLFAGCGKEPTPTNPPATNPPATNAPAGTTAPATTADDGRSPIGELPIVTDGSRPVLVVGLQQKPKTENYETNDYTLWIEEQTGVDLQFVYFSATDSEAEQQVTAMIAAGERLPDIMWDMTGGSRVEFWYNLGRDGYVIDLMPYIEEYGYWIKEAEQAVRDTVSDGDAEKIWAYGTDPMTGGFYALCDYTTQGIDACNSAMINQAFLEALDMEMPTTIEELYDYLVAVRDKDPNGNGKNDEIPLVWRDGGYRADTMEFLLNAFVFVNDTYCFNATDGQLWMPYTTDEYREGLKWLNKMYAEGLIFQGSWTMTSNEEVMTITCPADGVSIAGFIGGHPTLILDGVNEAIYDYVAFGPLKDATGKGGYSFKDSNGFNYTTGISADCEDPVLAFRVLDFMNCQESIIRQRFGNPGVHWEYATEGWNTNYNVPAAVVILDGTGYTEQGNACWHTCQGCIRPSYYWCSAVKQYTEEEARASVANWRQSKIGDAIPALFNAGTFPEEVVYNLVYNAEEAEVVSEYKALVEQYIGDARALFISGAMDPNSDADWNDYLKALENEGLSKWMEVAQSAYDRMNGK